MHWSLSYLSFSPAFGRSLRCCVPRILSKFPTIRLDALYLFGRAPASADKHASYKISSSFLGCSSALLPRLRSLAFTRINLRRRCLHCCRQRGVLFQAYLSQSQKLSRKQQTQFLILLNNASIESHHHTPVQTLSSTHQTNLSPQRGPQSPPAHLVHHIPRPANPPHHPSTIQAITPARPNTRPLPTLLQNTRQLIPPITLPSIRFSSTSPDAPVIMVPFGAAPASRLPAFRSSGRQGGHVGGGVEHLGLNGFDGVGGG